MLIGITPYPEEAGLLPKYSEICISENYEVEALVALNNRIAVRTGTIINYSQIFFKGVIDLVLVNEAGVQYTYNYLKFVDEGIAYGYGMDGKNKYITVTDLPAGTYIAYLASKAEKDTYYQPVKTEGLGAIGYRIVKHEDGSLEGFPGETVNLDGVVTGIKPVEMKNTGMTKTSKYIYDLNGRNMGTDPSALPKGVFIMHGRKVVK